ncbi:hypothetical protein [Paenibacillus sp. DMB20]|uniref:hypothetical protein n=1 Tax=Paenibacillus sp. DMB20 TaxID=1642570 RepID=UPI000B14EDE1|nr:hypothetical protein [Paenibacillus sp. DMB20]
MATIEVKFIHRVYANVIIDAMRTFASVPEKDKEPVRLALHEKGYEINESGDAVQI